MKNSILFLGVILILSSCGSSKFYQVYKVKPSDESLLITEDLIYEDDNCIISYNIWSEGGDIGFTFYNKTEENIFVNLDNCFFVSNGYANNYYKNRVYTTSKSNTNSVSKTSSGAVLLAALNAYSGVKTTGVKSSRTSNSASSSGNAVSYIEESLICIPSRTSKTISEYSINNSFILECDLKEYPSKKEVKTKSYLVEDSPYLFSNRISYTANGDSFQVINEFFISEITNLSSSEFFGYRNKEVCGKKSYSSTKFMKMYGKNLFYIDYLKEYN